MLRPKRKARARKQQKPVRTAVEITTEWIRSQRNERPSPREAFESLFAATDPQSA